MAPLSQSLVDRVCWLTSKAGRYYDGVWSQSLVDRVCWLTCGRTPHRRPSSQSLVDRVCWLTKASERIGQWKVSIPGRPGVLADAGSGCKKHSEVSQSLVDRVCWLTAFMADAANALLSQSLVDRVCWLTQKLLGDLARKGSQSLVDRVCWLTGICVAGPADRVSIPGRPGVLADTQAEHGYSNFLVSIPGRPGVLADYLKGDNRLVNLSQSLVDRVCWLTSTSWPATRRKRLNPWSTGCVG